MNRFYNFFAILGLLATIQAISLFLFCFGFFPQRTPLHGYNSLDQFPSIEEIRDVRQYLQHGIIRENRDINENNDNNIPHPASKNIPDSPFDKLIIMVVDALRSDFVFGTNTSSMNYTRYLLHSQQAIGFVAKAQAPTVTLARIKALTTGTIPSFIDFVSNFNSDELLMDSIIAQMAINNMTIHFYGDDTWLKLFPRHFTKHDATTTSFYVSDTVEVDNNVTRHVLPSLQRHQDWDTVIFHYLGLDHVGHLEGPKSLLMKPKQQEMDGIVQTIHEQLSTIDKGRDKSTLFLLCSDHGMNEVGNHGGSSEGEISPILIFMSSLFKGNSESHHTSDYTQVQVDHLVQQVNQVDLAPTISMLYRLPIPKNSLGKLIYPFVSFMYQHSTISEHIDNLPSQEIKTLLRYLEMNSYQQYCILKTNNVFWDAKNNAPQSDHINNVVQHYYDALNHHLEWLMDPANNRKAAEKAIQEYRRYLEESQSEWQHYLCSTDVILLWDAVALFALNAVALLCFAASVTIQNAEHLKAFNLHGRLYPDAVPSESPFSIMKVLAVVAFLGIVAGLNYAASVLSEEGSVIFRVPLIGGLLSGAFLMVSALIAVYWNSLWQIIPTIQWNFHKMFVIGGVILHLVSMAGSSTVEEEHQTWYFISITWYIVTYCSFYCKEDSPTEKSKGLRRPFMWFGTLGLVTRIIRNYNASGNKYLGAGLDIATIITNLSKYHPWLLPSLVIVSTSVVAFYGIMLAHMSRPVMGNSTSLGYQLALLTASLFTIYYKCGFSAEFHIVSETRAARIVYACVIICLIIAVTARLFRQLFRKSAYLRRHEMAICTMIILFILLHKPHNSFLLLLLAVQSQCVVTIIRDLMKRSHISIAEAVVVLTWFGEASFYSFGNSNSFATIDISGGYTGLTTYNEYAVGLLVGLIALSGPLMYLNALCRVLLSAFDSPGVRAPHFSLLGLTHTTLIACCTILGTKNLLLSLFSAVLTHLRHHLFVWSVFSPKFIYLAFFSLVDCIKILAVMFSAAYARRFWSRIKTE